jgi:hypothetical protein
MDSPIKKRDGHKPDSKTQVPPVLTIRVKAAERKAFAQAAALEEVKLDAWIRNALSYAAGLVQEVE